MHSAKNSTSSRPAADARREQRAEDRDGLGRHDAEEPGAVDARLERRLRLADHGRREEGVHHDHPEHDAGDPQRAGRASAARQNANWLPSTQVAGDHGEEPRARARGSFRSSSTRAEYDHEPDHVSTASTA